MDWKKREKKISRFHTQMDETGRRDVSNVRKSKTYLTRAPNKMEKKNGLQVISEKIVLEFSINLQHINPQTQGAQQSQKEQMKRNSQGHTD